MVTPLRFTTNAYPKEQRRDAWRFALSRSSLILDQIDEAALYGELIQFRSSTGINFLRVTGTPQSWSIDFREQPGSYWLAMILDGAAKMLYAQQTLELVSMDARRDGGIAGGPV